MKFVSNKRSAVGSQTTAVFRFSLLTLLVLAFVSVCFGQTAKVNVAEQIALVKEFEVNGLKVLVKRRPNMTTIAAGLFIRGGARNINEKNAGIENLMLEVATEGSKNFPREVLRKELSRTGSVISSGVNNDFSVISLASTRQNFDRSWQVFTDLALNPTFDKEDVERVKGRILTGLRESETDADNYLQVLQERIIYARHPYFNNVSGTIETVSRLTPAELSAYHREQMQTSRLLLVVVGDVDADDIQKRVAASFGKLPQGGYKEQTYPTLDFSKATIDVFSRPLPTNYIQGVFNAPALNHPDYFAMRVATTLLQSRLFEEVRLKRQLSYAPNAELNTLAANTANIYVTATDPNQTIGVMLNEIKNLKRNLVSEEEISGVAGQFLTSYYLKQETNAAQAGELARYELVGGGWRNAFLFLDKVREVKPADVQSVSQKYMKNIRFIVVGDPAAVNKEIFLQH